MVVHRFPDGPLAGQGWVNSAGEEVFDLVNGNHAQREIARQIAVWTDSQKQTTGSGNIFDRNAYVPSDNIFKQMVMAGDAIENDDIVGGTFDATEALAFQKLRWESSEMDDADVFNQWAAMVNLDDFARKCWLELAKNGQYVAARWWGFRDFKVRGNLPPKVDVDPITFDMTAQRDVDTGELLVGQKRRKTYQGVYCPVALTVIDSTKVVPMGSLMFGQEVLVWTATDEEMVVWREIETGDRSRYSDPIMATLFVGQYRPNDRERLMLQKLGVKQSENLLILNPDYVWRHTLTRPDYQPWAKHPMKRVFRWLDLKQQLMASDRVALIGNANYILLVKKGEKDNPATEAEINELNENFAYIARLPVVIGDHTLSIEIITPKQEFTLKKERYDVVDSHIRDSMLQTFTQHSSGSREGATGTEVTVKSIARGLSNRRHGIKRDWERAFASAIVDHPFNRDKFEGEPNLAFSPRAIVLEQDQATLNAFIALSARGDISRQTTLEETLDLDQEVEAQRREHERIHYDPIFKTAVPFNGNDDPMSPGGGPGNNGGQLQPPGAGGGGRPPGGSSTKKAATPATPKSAGTRTRPARGKNA